MLQTRRVAEMHFQSIIIVPRWMMRLFHLPFLPTIFKKEFRFRGGQAPKKPGPVARETCGATRAVSAALPAPPRRRRQPQLLSFPLPPFPGYLQRFSTARPISPLPLRPSSTAAARNESAKRILAYNVTQGFVSTPGYGYHETVTWFWVERIGDLIQGLGRGATEWEAARTRSTIRPTFLISSGHEL